MPSNKALGFASLTDNFLKTYLSITQMKKQDKESKKLRQAQALSTLISNDDIPLEQQLNYVDLFEDAIGAPKGSLLTPMIQLAGKDVDTGRTVSKTQTTNTPTTIGPSLENVQTRDDITDKVGEPPTLTYNKQSQTQVQSPEIVKRGSLSLRDIKGIDAAKAERRKAELEFELRDRVLKSSGYEKSPETVYDEAKNSFQVYTNPNNPDKPAVYIPLNPNGPKTPVGLVETESTLNRRLAAEQNRGELGTFEKAIEAQNPNWTKEQVRAEASRQYLSYKENISKAAENRVTGNVPTTTQQDREFEEQRKRQLKSIEDDITDIEADIKQNDDEADSAYKRQQAIEQRRTYLESRIGYLTSIAEDDLTKEQASELSKVRGEFERSNDDLLREQTSAANARAKANAARLKLNKKKRQLADNGGTYVSSETKEASSEVKANSITIPQSVIDTYISNTGFTSEKIIADIKKKKSKELGYDVEIIIDPKK